MTLDEVSARLDLESLTPDLPGAGLREISAGYVSDLLSDVLAHGPQGGVLVTVQVHMNVIAVAVHAGLSGVIFSMDRRPDEPVRLKAVEEGVALYASHAPSFEIAGRLYEMGLRGNHV